MRRAAASRRARPSNPAFARRRGPTSSCPGCARPMGHFFRGEMALSRNDADTALHEFEAAVRADPASPMLRARLAALYVRAGQLDKALEQCRAALAAEPENPEMLGLVAGILSS